MRELIARSNWINLSVAFIFILFSIVLVVVTISAYTRQSGVTKIDMSKVQELRRQAVYSNQNSAD